MRSFSSYKNLSINNVINWQSLAGRQTNTGVGKLAQEHNPFLAQKML
jgi:hypothetical protein